MININSIKQEDLNSLKEAMEFATRMGESGHRTRIKEDVGH